MIALVVAAAANGKLGREVARPRTYRQATFRETDAALDRFDGALAEALRRASHAVTDSGPCDVEVHRRLRFAAEPREQRHHTVDVDRIAHAVMDLYGPGGQGIDRFELQAAEDLESEGVAVELVNVMLASPKVKRFATERSRTP